MLRFDRIALLAGVVLSLTIAAAAQVPANSRFINTASFFDEKAGITKLVAAEKQISADFAKDIKELQDGNARLAIIAEDLQKPVTDANRAAMLLKKEEGEALQRRLEFRKTEIESQIAKRREKDIKPITFDIGKAIAEFGRKNGYVAIFDAEKMIGDGSVLFVSDENDVTKAFIAYYNARAAAVPVK